MRQFDAANRGDFNAAIQTVSEDVELFVCASFLDSGTYHGIEAVGQWFLSWFGSFAPGYSFEIRDLTYVAPAVFVVAAHHGTGRASGAEMDWRTFNVYWVRDGRVVRIEFHATEEDARAAIAGSA